MRIVNCEETKVAMSPVSEVVTLELNEEQAEEERKLNLEVKELTEKLH